MSCVDCSWTYHKAFSAQKTRLHVLHCLFFQTVLQIKNGTSQTCFVKIPAVQLAVHEPQAIHLSTSGSRSINLFHFSLSLSSRLILELGVNEYPKPVIILNFLCSCR